MQKGASGSESSALGMACVHLQTAPSFKQIEQHPPGALGVAKPCTTLSLLPTPSC